MQKYALVFALVLVLASSSFAAQAPIIKYYSDDVSSHACAPNSMLCLFGVQVDDTYMRDCAAADSIGAIGLTDSFNAHAETKDFNNYDFNVCMAGDIFSSGTCKYQTGGCSPGYSCIFAMDSKTNSHLSSCGVFGNGEYELCCTFSGTPIAPYLGKGGGCNISYVVAENMALDQNVRVRFACDRPSSGLWLTFFDPSGKPLFPDNGKPLKIASCSPDESGFSVFLLPPGSPPGVYIVRLYDEDCAKDAYFSVSGTRAQMVPVPDASPLAAFAVALAACAMIIFRKSRK